jgi:predicted unusual protein kinase regulating ubiquinone biosynthesis (AarF/ABC1/UbiB family)
MVTALSRLGFIGEGANLMAIERGVALMMEQYHGMTLGEARALNMSEVAHEIEDLFYRQPFRIPAQFAFTGRAVGTLSGLATGLAPEFNLVSVAVPYAQTFLGLNRNGANETAQQVLTQLLDAGRTMLTLPATFDRVLNKIDAGQLEVHIGQDGQTGRGGRVRRASVVRQASGTVSILVVCVAALSAGAFLMTNQIDIPGWFCLGLGAVAGVRVLLRR